MTRPAGRPPRLLAAALAAADRGWPVFPLHPRSKRPAVKRWETVASCDPDRIVAWWAAAPYNIAIPCGPAGLLVVDLDGPGGTPPAWALEGVHDGRGVLAVLAGRAGADDPADTHTVATPAGEHRYFTVDPAQPGRCTVGALGWHVDTRGRGGFVVAAGSTRTVAGRRRYYRTVNPATPAPAPAWLLDKLAFPCPGGTMAQAGPAPAVRRTGAYSRAALLAEAAAVHDARLGTRNATLFRAAAHLGELVAAGLVDEHLVVHALRAAAHSHAGLDGFTSQEADRAIANGIRRGLQHPRSITTISR
jgi:hypothetical protein